MTIPRPIQAFAAFCVLTFMASSQARADEPPALRIYQASDVAHLASGFGLPRAGTYTIKVWAPAKSDWSIKVEGRSLVLSRQSNDDAGTPEWRTLGTIAFDAQAPLTLRVAGPPEVAPQPDTKEKAASKATAKPKPPTPVPALIAFTTDAGKDLTTTLDLIRGRVDGIAPVADDRRMTSRTRDQGANFQPPTSRQAWLDRASHVREQLLVALGLWPMLPKTELRPQVFGKIDREGYTIEKVVLETLPGFTLSGNLYRPTGKTGRLPLVLCPHGHWKDGRVNPEVQARCIWWAKKLGCVVFMYDMVGYNDSKDFGHAFLNDRLRRWGLSLMTLQTWNSIRALDWATALPDVDPARVGCTGESGGGTQTFILTAIDQRIKVAGPVVMVSHKMQGGCLCENCAGLRIGTDNVEIAALTAPRPMKIVGANDWTDETMTVEYPTLKKVYTLLGSPDRISADKFEFEHNYNQTTRNAVYAFMGRWLVGIEDSASTREGEVKPETPETLWTFGKDHPKPPSPKSPEALEAELIETMTRSLDKLAPSTVAATWEAARNLLLTALCVRVGLSEPSAGELTAKEIRRTAREGVTAVHFEVGRLGAKDHVPIVRWIPRNATGRTTLIATPRGKIDLLASDGQPIALVKALLARGQSVVGFDPIFVGESCDPKIPTLARPVVDHFATYNPSLAADQSQDLATVLSWLRTLPDVREISLVGLGEAGPRTLIARPILSGLARTVIDLNRFDHGDGSSPVPPALDFPGVLQFGGLKTAAALSAPSPLWITNPPKGFDRAWPVKAYSLADASGCLRIDDSLATAEAVSRWIDAGE